MKRLYTLLLFVGITVSSFSQNQDTIKLLKPDTVGGKPLMQLLKERKTTRDIKEGVLTDQQLSNLLWAAYGVNRPNGKRTAPSAMNRQEFDLYVSLKKGLFVYDALKNLLIPVLSEDLRGQITKQDFPAKAAAMLVYVADYEKMGNTSEADKQFYAATDVGFICQNVYLYCASENLATVVLGWIDKDKVAKLFKLKDTQKVILTQCVGIPE